MNDLFAMVGITGWKPVLTALLLPPVPLLVLAVLGARMILWRRGVAWLVLVLAVAGLWLSSCTVVAEWLQRAVLPMTPVLSADAIADLKRDVAARRKVTIVVLGGGRDALAPEYGVSDLKPVSLIRLRYGLWLGRETGAPVAFSGGNGHAEPDGPSEAEVARRIAEQEFGRRLQWVETESRDTRENADLTVKLLRDQHAADTVVLVTHGWHLPRARRAFEEALARRGVTATVVGAPVGLARDRGLVALRWMPSIDGFTLTRRVLREKLGWWSGA